MRRENVHLTDAMRRAEFVDRVTREANKVLIVTEGLLVYADAAKYVIDRGGVIRAAEVNADYTMRPNLSEMLMLLKKSTH